MEPLDREIVRALKDQSPTSKGPAKVLVVGAVGHCQSALIPALQERKHQCTEVCRLGEARAAVSRRRFDVILLHDRLPDGAGVELLKLVHKTLPTTKVIMMGETPVQETFIEAMRAGAVDFIDPASCTAEAFLERVDAAIIRSRADRHREQRITRLERICKELNSARREVTKQVDGLCEDLSSAYQEISDQMNEVAMSTEFRTLVRQELDVEDLLRTKLEYLLTKTGPTNAAVFLPDEDRNFALGAYVNYDCPRETVSMLLDHLCAAICPQMADENELVLFDDAAEFAEWIGMDAGVLGESQVMAYSCMHEGECLAVVVLFRSKSDPFGLDLANAIDILRPIFAQQLSTIIRIHHRASPEWPDENLGDEHDFHDDYGFGGIAA